LLLGALSGPIEQNVIPAQAGTQYSAALRFYRQRLRLLDPRFRGDDAVRGDVSR